MSFIWSQFFGAPAYPKTSLAGQTIIITGSNAGLGLEAARHCTRLEAKKVILAVRNLKAGEEAKTSIESTTGRQNVVEVWKLDLGDYASVKAFAKRVTTELDRLDVLLENAGIATLKFAKAEEDESTVTVNVVSTFLLALMLLPKLQETATKFQIKPRLVIVTSEVHGWTKFEERSAPSILDALNDESKANMDERYPTSKLLEVLTIRQIAPMISKSKNSDVILNMLNPGLCHSSLAREMEDWKFWLMKLVLARSTECGSRTLVASAVAGPESHGKYMSDGLVKDNQVVSWVQTPEGKKVEEKLWKELSAKLEKIEPGVTKCLD